MLCCTRALRAALPFTPMALSTLSKLETRLEALAESEASGAAAGDEQDAACRGGNASGGGGLRGGAAGERDARQRRIKTRDLQWFRGDGVFFISPKHDGIRLISCPDAPPQQPTQPTTTTPRAGKRAKPARARELSTCYSRHGRAITGLFWVEQELALLRALCGDPRLILDGELYIHREGGAGGEAAAPGKSTPRAKKRGRAKGAKQEGGDGADGAASEASKVGFLEVSGLVHRLRGTRSRCHTAADVMQFVSSFPQFCVFDVASYSPQAPPAMAEQQQQHPEAVQEALQDALHQTLRAHGLPGAEVLRCTPNLTPFSQRLRTLLFLCDLLQCGMGAPALREHFGLPAAGAPAESRVALRYRGGTYVQFIPYDVCRSVAAARDAFLPHYTAAGYEGAVIRTPTNVYEMKEKRRGTIRGLVEALRAEPDGGAEDEEEGAEAALGGLGAAFPAHAILNHDVLYGKQAGGRPAGVTARQQLQLQQQRGRQGLLRGRLAAAAAGKRGRGGAAAAAAAPQRSCEVGERLAEAAVSSARVLSGRAETAVKILPYNDSEYVILRPLFREPSDNPLTRPLLMVPLNPPQLKGLSFPVKKNTDGGGGAAAGSSSKGGKSKGKSKYVCFYGLQCLAPNGRAFNTSLPRMEKSKQEALLRHLLDCMKKRKSLTGLYATVKYPNLTEYGVPRFGTVKAIRGGKGWFL